MSEPTNEEKLEIISEMLSRNKRRIAMVLPEGLSFEEFHTSFVTACRKTKDIWTCERDSIFDAALDSAMDGLPCDGKHAAIVVRSENVGTRSNKIYKNIARYTPMAYGIRKKIIESGAAVTIDTTIIYANEYCKILKGTAPSIEHEVMVSADRGDWVGVYSVAELTGGQKTIEVMTKADVMDVKESAQTKSVWDNNETEMARKTVLRRHSKSLSGRHMMVDIEQRRMFAMIDRRYDPQAAPAKPTRQAQALEDHSRNQPINNFGSSREEERQPVEAQSSESAQESKMQEQRQADPEDRAARTGDIFDMPQSASEFDLWSIGLLDEIQKSDDFDEVTELRRANAEITAAAPEDVREEVEGAFTARLADLS